jgi:hypothetical protein
MTSSWERKGREGVGARLGVRVGEREGCRGAPRRLPLGAMRALCTWLAAVREEGRRKERRKEKEGKEKRKKIWKFF